MKTLFTVLLMISSSTFAFFGSGNSFSPFGSSNNFSPFGSGTGFNNTAPWGLGSGFSPFGSSNSRWHPRYDQINMMRYAPPISVPLNNYSTSPYGYPTFSEPNPKNWLTYTDFTSTLDRTSPEDKVFNANDRRSGFNRIMSSGRYFKEGPAKN